MSEINLDDYQQTALQHLNQVTTDEDLEAWQLQFLGRKSPLAQFSQSIKALPIEDRAAAGQRLNQTKQALEQVAESKRQALSPASRIDMSVPVVLPVSGHLHPTTQTIQEIFQIFSHLGMDFVEAPEVDYDWYAFESLNMGADHPARDEWETFFIDVPADPKKGKVVLRPHTTNFEAHVMEDQKPPIQVFTVGTTYRRQSDASHTPMFHQFEGFVIAKDLSIGNLIATLEYFVHNFFGPEIKTRLRPYHFRFTEPSFELDITCTACGGKGCKLCKEGWLELGGAGMTHPAVLKAGGLDPEIYNGYAWGWGVERCLVIRHGMDDLRQIYENDIRFLEQF